MPDDESPRRSRGIAQAPVRGRSNAGSALEQLQDGFGHCRCPSGSRRRGRSGGWRPRSPRGRRRARGRLAPSGSASARHSRRPGRAAPTHSSRSRPSRVMSRGGAGVGAGVGSEGRGAGRAAGAGSGRRRTWRRRRLPGMDRRASWRASPARPAGPPCAAEPRRRRRGGAPPGRRRMRPVAMSP